MEHCNGCFFSFLLTHSYNTFVQSPTREVENAFCFPLGLCLSWTLWIMQCPAPAQSWLADAGHPYMILIFHLQCLHKGWRALCV